eukprot:CAMPEP_0204355236 /NCGR_PEP_ID=MMETSP0469-20131031/33997_1 /ASSEMBLY_ACC=CAM_ASM_000384 /TAXON_ID=2969 /ORGANISM="Oxyrrhis marina" /LENGTH=43 /DNA_ID= /DNA_START= /DNA_END= /DNA_ORIENTATION=
MAVRGVNEVWQVVVGGGCTASGGRAIDARHGFRAQEEACLVGA